MNNRIDRIRLPGNASEISILRLDLPDPLTGGNKSFKLKYNLLSMKEKGQRRLITFGGAYSNYIAAVAASVRDSGIEAIGIIRGEELNEQSNDVLAFAISCGMKLKFVTREEYGRRYDGSWHTQLLSELEADIVLPEGGSNELAVKGCMEILNGTDEFDHIYCAVGTGATLAGIILSAKNHQHVHGITVLNAAEQLGNNVKSFLADREVECQWQLHDEFTFGGYAKSTPGLERFITDMRTNHGLRLDRIYTGKAFKGMLVSLGNEKIKAPLFIHTGGYAFTQ